MPVEGPPLGDLMSHKLRPPARSASHQREKGWRELRLPCYLVTDELHHPPPCSAIVNSTEHDEGCGCSFCGRDLGRDKKRKGFAVMPTCTEGHAPDNCQLALPWGTRHLISHELAGKDVMILLLLLSWLSPPQAYFS